jgi:hypothetical protein
VFGRFHFNEDFIDVFTSYGLESVDVAADSRLKFRLVVYNLEKQILGNR